MAYYNIPMKDRTKIKNFLGDMYIYCEDKKIYFKEPSSHKLYDMWHESFIKFRKTLDGNYWFQSKTLSEGAFIFRHG